MRQLQDAPATPFDAAFTQHYETIRKLLTTQVRAVLAKWGPAVRPEQVEDEVADLLIGVVKAKASFDPTRGPFVGWANTIAMRRLADRQRRLFRERNRPQVFTRSGFPTDELFDLLVDAASARDTPRPAAPPVELLMTEVDRLPQRQRQVIRRRFLEQAEYAVIAVELGVTEAAVRGLACRGLQLLSERVRAAGHRGDPGHAA